MGRGHNRQLYGHWEDIKSHNALFYRSIFGMCDIYNNLSQQVVDCSSVSEFQVFLTRLARNRCEDGDAAWAASYSRHGDNNDL